MASTSVAADGPYLYGRYADDTMLKTALLVVEQSSVKCSSRDYNQKVFENATVARILDGRLQFYMDLWDMSGQHYNRSTAIFPQPCTAVLLVYAPQFPASLHIMPHFAQRARRSTGTGCKLFLVGIMVPDDTVKHLEMQDIEGIKQQRPANCPVVTLQEESAAVKEMGCDGVFRCSLDDPDEVHRIFQSVVAAEVLKFYGVKPGGAKNSLFSRLSAMFTKSPNKHGAATTEAPSIWGDEQKHSNAGVSSGVAVLPKTTVVVAATASSAAPVNPAPRADTASPADPPPVLNGATSYADVETYLKDLEQRVQVATKELQSKPTGAAAADTYDGHAYAASAASKALVEVQGRLPELRTALDEARCHLQREQERQHLCALQCSGVVDYYWFLQLQINGTFQAAAALHSRWIETYASGKVPQSKAGEFIEQLSKVGASLSNGIPIAGTVCRIIERVTTRWNDAERRKAVNALAQYFAADSTRLSVFAEKLARTCTLYQVPILESLDDSVKRKAVQPTAVSFGDRVVYHLKRLEQLRKRVVQDDISSEIRELADHHCTLLIEAVISDDEKSRRLPQRVEPHENMDLSPFLCVILGPTYAKVLKYSAARAGSGSGVTTGPAAPQSPMATVASVLPAHVPAHVMTGDGIAPSMSTSAGAAITEEVASAARVKKLEDELRSLRSQVDKKLKDRSGSNGGGGGQVQLFAEQDEASGGSGVVLKDVQQHAQHHDAVLQLHADAHDHHRSELSDQRALILQLQEQVEALQRKQHR